MCDFEEIHKRLRDFEEIEISRLSCKGVCEEQGCKLEDFRLDFLQEFTLGTNRTYLYYFLVYLNFSINKSTIVLYSTVYDRGKLLQCVIYASITFFSVLNFD